MSTHKFEDAAAKVEQGQPVEVSVRTLLDWFDASRRSWRNVNRIRNALNERDLTTLPDFEGVWIDATVSMVRKLSPESAPRTADAPITSSSEALLTTHAAEGRTHAPPVTSTSELDSKADIELETKPVEPAHKIKRLPAANRQPVSIPPDATVAEAITLMLRYDFSQLPVMQNPNAREVKGMVTWKSIGSRLAVERPCERVRDCMDRHQEIASDASLFDAIRVIAEYDSVLVRASDRTYSGIVTAYDISAQFQQLAEPFLLLSDIENYIRFLISRALSLDELRRGKDPEDADRQIHDVSDLTFGEYIRLLQSEQNWEKLRMKFDRTTFIGWLDKVREIRNDIMHFDPDPIEPPNMQLLKDMARFLTTWNELVSHH